MRLSLPRIDNAKSALKIGGFILFFIFIISFAFFGSYDLIFGLKITKVDINGSPAETVGTLNVNVIKVTGNAKNAIKISINGREITVDQAGNFDETIVLLSGYNIVNITAADKFGHSDIKNYQLTYASVAS